MSCTNPIEPERRGPLPASVSLDDLLQASSDARLLALIGGLGVKAGTRAYLEELRWPDGVACPRCASERTGWLASREKYYCRGCGYQFRVTAGTLFQDSHISLTRWLIAVQLMLDAERGFPAMRLQQMIGGSYKTAWFVGHRIRAAMSGKLLDLGMPLALATAVEVADRAAMPSAVLKPTGPAGEGWAYVKRLVAGPYHRPSPEHLTAYWNESRWRATNIDNEHVFRETVVALLETGPLLYRDLIDGTQPRLTAPPAPSCFRS